MFMITCWCSACAPPAAPLQSSAPEYSFPTAQPTDMTLPPSSNLGDATIDDQVATPQLSGRWTLTQRTALHTQLPVIDTLVITLIETTALVEITQRDTSLMIHQETCDVYMENTPAFGHTRLPDALISAMPTRGRPATLSLSPSGEWTLEAERHPDIRGVTLIDPYSDPLPMSPDDPRIFDADLDGHPGVTVTLYGFPAGDVYMIQRTWDTLNGAVRSPSLIEGEVMWEDEQFFIDATEEILLVDIDRWIPVGVELHTFTLERSEALTCGPRRPPALVGD
jgi:hypothetical protein